ncbi:MAG: hypothetical protein Q7J57_12895 [Gemmobacter sp.]|nr:hypothetical protein [Gemmobacter sp.]
MGTETIDDDILMAYVDGTLDFDGMAQVEAAVADSEEVAVRLAELFESRAALLDDPDADPAPTDEALGMATAPGAAQGSPANIPGRSVAWQLMALAASVALVVGLGAGWMLAGGSNTEASSPVPPVAPPPAAQATLLDNTEIVAALATLPAGESLALAGGGEVRAIATHRNTAGTLCRGVEHDRADRQTVIAVVCRDGGQWNPQLTVAAPAEQTGYAPLSSLEVMDSYLALTGAGESLSPEDEAAALADLR